MPRFRKYRFFLMFAAVCIFVLLKFTNSGFRLQNTTFEFSAPIHKEPLEPPALTPTSSALPKDNLQTSAPALHSSSASTFPAKATDLPAIIPPNAQSNSLHVQSIPNIVPPHRISNAPTRISSTENEQALHFIPPPGRQDAVGSAALTATVHWQKQAEHFPVPAASVIKLPAGKPLNIPKIQYSFTDETPDEKITREKRQTRVRDEFKRAWNGYKEKAWLHDELSPVSGTFRDPFCGWAATLVDTLDTLWIMGLEEEFDESARAVDLIDFTVSSRADIPVFETTIRYLGGLLAAYDVSGEKYNNLLAKAVELGDILIGAFDTPNRMPVLYYYWAPEFASQPHRASTRSNLAELGSLSMEFTRLSQLTKDPKYYDAIARVSNALSEWQDRGTGLDGVFPISVDASGCNLTQPIIPSSPLQVETLKESEIKMKRNLDTGTDNTEKEKSTSGSANTIDAAAGSVFTSPDPNTQFKPKSLDWDCIPQGLAPSTRGSQEYSMAGGQDSTYEYFPKQYLLLGGLEGQYHKMYVKTVDAIKKWMIFRPMLPDNRDILFSGSIRTSSTSDLGPIFTGDVNHLTCFIGGMVGLGAKVFSLESDLELAKKLSEGCVWAYMATPSGIMPESAKLATCESLTDCTWNETHYSELLDQIGTARDDNVKKYIQEKALRDAKIKADTLQAARQAAKARTHIAEATAVDPQEKSDHEHGNDSKIDIIALSKDTSDSLKKRQFPNSLKNENPVPNVPTSDNFEDIQKFSQNRLGMSSDLNTLSPEQALNRIKELEAQLQQVTAAAHLSEKPITESKEDPNSDLNRPLGHKEYVENRIKKEHLPPGFVNIFSTKYILRPEAIESVWYMYRITGDTSWADKGWTMFESIIKATSTNHGHSAILDVLSNQTKQSDEMESFWLAETLKYFYLLYSTSDTISLDEWVLNTEAHPFRRPV